MFQNYFKTALRNLWRSRTFSLINILGLSVGLACCMLIFLYSKDEISYDRFHEKKDNLYRLTVDMTHSDGKVDKIGSTGMVPGPAFKRTIPEVEDFVRVQSASFNIKHGKDVFDQPALYVDSNFFSAFSFPLVAGNSKTALNDIHSVVLSEDVAKKYFGQQKAIGQILELNTGERFEPFIVSAIAKRSPQNSSIKIDMLVPMKFAQSQSEDNQWMNFFLNTFIVLKPATNPREVEAKFESVFRTEAAVQVKEMEEKFGLKDKVRFGLQPLLQMHLSKDYPADNGLTDASNPIYSYILTGIALFILLIACINFINLTVAHSLKRAKEIGIRKVIGGQRNQLILQFLGETFILTFIAFVFAILLLKLVLPFFNELANKSLAISYLFDVKLVAGYVFLFLLTGLLAGFYPALVLSRFNPVQTLYGRFRLTGRNYLAKGLVVFQFTLATFLIVATMIIYSQFNYLTHFDLGYNDENVAILNTGHIDREKLEVFKTELLKNSSIAGVTADQGGRWGTIAHVNDGKEMNFDFKHVDENYFPLFKIPIVTGRNFSTDFVSDTAEAAIINQTFAKEAGWKDPVGNQVDFFYMNKKYRVVGVIKDYHYLSLAEKIGPQLFTMNPRYKYRDVFIKLKPGNVSASLKYLEKTFKALFPARPYQYNFKDAQNDAQYEREAKWKQIITFGAVLTIFISCIGLFGLATLSAEKRTKEIGIRKVLGASVTIIAGKLSTDFLKLVMLASIIASPIAWWVMNKWLQNYPYRVPINWWMFGFAVLAVVLVAFVTISYQAIKAAIANPVKSLRTE
ncbi:ABC transporter permease [Segetibacter aerophilus]|uniref:ABC transporter permease n=1 Tax=Segetibacter aerophilus TaxID=670293 RepID=A0A512BBB2_9BACT|nr:ABC transporter permease [Segetibacter aerophilus]GEO09220.1 ABC transporter permease [Segetibacter aerophilus]